MTDERLRESERRWRAGDPAEEVRWLRERLRAGTLVPARLEAARQLGHPPALELLGPLPPGPTPAALVDASLPGIEVEGVPGFPRAVHLRLTRWSGDARLVEGVFVRLAGLGMRSILVEIDDPRALASSLLGVLTTRIEMLHRAGGELILFDLPGPLRTVLEMLGLDGLFLQAVSREDALGIVRAREAVRALAEVPAMPAAPIRLGIAALRVSLPGFAAGHPHDPRPARLLAALDAWVATPTPPSGTAVQDAAAPLHALLAAGPEVDGAVMWAVWTADVVRLESGERPSEEPLRLRPRLREAEVEAVRSEVVAWLLGE